MVNFLTIALGAAFVITLALLLRSLFRQARIQDQAKETAQSAKHQLALWEEFGQHLDEGVALANEKHEVVYANHAFAEMTQWPNRAAFNQHLSDVLVLQDEAAKLTEVPPGKVSGPLYVIGKDGLRTPVRAVKRALSRPTGYTVTLLANAAAEQAENELRQRLANLSSFELRAPATAIKGYTSMLLEGDAGKLPSEAKELLEPIYNGANRLLAIIDDLSQLELLSSKKMELHKKPIKVATFLQQLEPQLAIVTKQAGQMLKLGTGNLATQVEVDQAQIGRVLAMLTGTAARTAQAGSGVSLLAQETPRTVDMVIENNGSPLPKEHQANVFDFAGGQGLEEGVGFYLAKQIIDAHDAYVTVNAKTDGNVFILSLPKSLKPATTGRSPAKRSKTEPLGPAATPDAIPDHRATKAATPPPKRSGVHADIRKPNT